MSRQISNHTKEYLLYGLLLVVVFLYPFLHAGENALDSGIFQWNYILQKWGETVPFIILLLIHSFVLLPMLFDKKHIGKYVFMVVLLVGVFFIYVNHQHSSKNPQYPTHEMAPRNLPYHYEPLQDKPSLPPKYEKEAKSQKPKGPIIIDTLIAVLLIGCSLAIKLMFKHYENSRKMEELEKVRITQELAQLKAQISPHFFMNSLNNIHGMIEMDSQKAQNMILELSGMMRYVLYESSTSMIVLTKEIDFLNNYISLMRVRYNSNKVAIQYSFPGREACVSIYVPPLMFIVFIENAFKHGVDYQSSSFIHIELSLRDDQLTLHCVNSMNQSKKQNAKGGIGLDNIRKRLDILYGNAYSLDAHVVGELFVVTLIIPTKNENQMCRS